MLPLTKKEKKHTRNKFCHICREKFDEFNENQNYCKVWDYCQFTRNIWAAHSICYVRYKMPKNSCSVS